MSNKELADGTVYAKPLQTSWTPPKWIIRKGQKYVDHVRKTKQILIQGKNNNNLIFKIKSIFIR